MLLLAACAAAPAPAPCERSLDGVWVTGARIDGEDIGWHFLDHGGSVEGYPTYRDLPDGLPPGVRAAPSMIELVRAPDGTLAGRVLRRYQLGGQRCTIAAPVHVTACAGAALTLELGALAPPADWPACGQPADAATLARATLTAPRVVQLHR